VLHLKNTLIFENESKDAKIIGNNTFFFFKKKDVMKIRRRRKKHKRRQGYVVMSIVIKKTTVYSLKKMSWQTNLDILDVNQISSTYLWLLNGWDVL